MSSPRTQTGFTLMELIVVIVILGLMLGFAAPKVSQTFFRDEAITALNRLAHALETERRAAMERNQDLALCLKPGFEEITSEDDRVIMTLPDTLRVDHVAFSHRRTEPGPDMELCIRFHPKGFADGAVIHLSHADGRLFSLKVRPFLHKTEVVTGHVSPDHP